MNQIEQKVFLAWEIQLVVTTREGGKELGKSGKNHKIV